MEGVPAHGVRVGAQLTPPRQFVDARYRRASADERGGRSSRCRAWPWAASAPPGGRPPSPTPTPSWRIGIFEPGFARHYDEVAPSVGVSGEPDGRRLATLLRGSGAIQQPPLELDSVARCVWEPYQRAVRTSCAAASRSGGRRWRSLARPRRAACEPLLRHGFLGGLAALGLPPALSDRGAREASELQARAPAARARASSRGRAAFGSTAGTWRAAQRETFRARRLCCAPAPSTRRASRSRLSGSRTFAVPMLCNPYLYLPCIALPMLGRAAMDRRHSLSQLVAICAPPDAPDDVVSAQFYGYRSLLLFKLVKEIPLPAWAGLQIARLVVIEPRDRRRPSFGCAARGQDAADPAARERTSCRRCGSTIGHQRRGAGDPAPARGRLVRQLLRLGVVPYAKLDRRAAPRASTMPGRSRSAATPALPFASRRMGACGRRRTSMSGTARAGASSRPRASRYTIMANARRVAEHVLRDLGLAA